MKRIHKYFCCCCFPIGKGPGGPKLERHRKTGRGSGLGLPGRGRGSRWVHQVLPYFGTPIVRPLTAGRRGAGWPGGRSFTRGPADRPCDSQSGAWAGWIRRQRAQCLHFPELLAHLKNPSCLSALGKGVCRGADLPPPNYHYPLPNTVQIERGDLLFPNAASFCHRPAAGE